MHCDIGDFGAIPDGRTLNTAAIQQAINAVHSAGGGRVNCGPGTWLSGCVDLRSHVELHLEPGARLLASPHLEDYELLQAKGFNADAAPEKSAHSLLRAVEAEDIAITGSGTIDGQGLCFYDTGQTTGKLDKPDTPRPRLVMFYRCRSLRIEGCAFVDSACWSIWLMQCENARINGITVTGDRRMRNVDGIDVDACRNVTISDCRFDTEDDCIAVRAIQVLYDTPAICENIIVTNCLMKSGCQGVRVGCPSDGVIRHVTFSELIIESTLNGIMLQNPHRYLRAGTPGAHIHDIQFSDVILTCERTPIGIIVDEGIELSRLSDLSFTNFRIRSGEPCKVQGSSQRVVRNVRFSNLSIETPADSAFLSRHCEGLHLDEIHISSTATGEAP